MKLPFLIILTLLFGLSFVTTEVYHHKLQSDNTEEILNLYDIRSKITLNDEVLSFSAEMMSLTGDEKWENRYLNAERELSSVLEEASQYKYNRQVAKFIENISRANEELIKFEKESFAFSKNNQQKEAYNILNSGDYLEHKAEYLQNVNGLVREILGMRSSLQKSSKYLALYFSLFHGLGLFVLGFLWISRTKKLNESSTTELNNFKNILFSTLDNLPALAWAKDPQSRFIFVNEKFQDVTNMKKEEIVNKTDLDLFDNTELAKSYQADDRWVMDNGKKIEREEMVPDIDGNEKLHLTIKYPLYDSNERCVGAGGCTFDISEIKEAETKLRSTLRELKEKESEQRAILSTVKVAVFCLDSNGDIRSQNQEVSNLMGWTKDELQGQSINKVLNSEDHIDFKRNLSMITEIGNMPRQGKEVVVVTKAGETIPAVMHISCFIKEHEPCYTIAIDEISSVKRKDEKLESENRKLEGRLKELQSQLFKIEAQFHGLVEASPGMIFQFQMNSSKEFKFNFVSSKVHEIYDLSSEDFRKNPLTIVDMAVGEHKDTLRKAIETSSISLEKFTWSGLIQSDRGAFKWLRADATPQKLADQTIVWDGLVVDVSAQSEYSGRINDHLKLAN